MLGMIFKKYNFKRSVYNITIRDLSSFLNASISSSDHVSVSVYTGFKII